MPTANENIEIVEAVLALTSAARGVSVPPEGLEQLERLLRGAARHELAAVRRALEASEAWAWIPAAARLVSSRLSGSPEDQLELLRWRELHSFAMRSREDHAVAAATALEVANRRLPLHLGDDEIDPRARAWETVGIYHSLRENHDGALDAFNRAAGHSRSWEYSCRILHALPVLLASRRHALAHDWILQAEQRLSRIVDVHRRTDSRTQLLSYKGVILARLSDPASGLHAQRNAYELARTSVARLVLLVRARLAAQLLHENPAEARRLLDEEAGDRETDADGWFELHLVRALDFQSRRELHHARLTCERMVAALPDRMPQWPDLLRRPARVLETAAKVIRAQEDTHASNVCETALTSVRELRIRLREEPVSCCEEALVEASKAVHELKRLLTARAGGRIVTTKFVIYLIDRTLEFRDTGARQPLDEWFVAVLQHLAMQPNDPARGHRVPVSRAEMQHIMRTNGKSATEEGVRQAIKKEKDRLGLARGDLILGLPHRGGGYYLEI